MGSRGASPPGTKRQVIEGCPMRGSRKTQVTRHSNPGSKHVEVSPLGDIGPQGPLAGAKQRGVQKMALSEKETKRRKERKQKEEKRCPALALVRHRERRNMALTRLRNSIPAGLCPSDQPFKSSTCVSSSFASSLGAFPVAVSTRDPAEGKSVCGFLRIVPQVATAL